MFSLIRSVYIESARLEAFLRKIRQAMATSVNLVLLLRVRLTPIDPECRLRHHRSVLDTRSLPVPTVMTDRPVPTRT